MNIKMLKPNTFIKATTTILATCMLMACGGESSDSDTIANTTHVMTLAAPEMGPTEGKSIFTLNVKDADGFAVNAVVPMMMPMMTMVNGHQHSTPNLGCQETDAEGNAQCTLYFSMASGPTMGVWNLGFTLPNSEQAAIEFTPAVSMAMGDTKKTKLKGIDDTIAGMEMDGMTMPASREYQIYNNGLTGMGDNRSIELFIAAKESMMSYPALVQNQALNDGSADYELTPTSIDVKVSTNNSDWVDATTSGGGVWNASSLTGLVDNQEATLYVKLAVNGEDKTTNGETADGINASAQFTLKMTSGDMSVMNGAM